MHAAAFDSKDLSMVCRLTMVVVSGQMDVSALEVCMGEILHYEM